MHAIPTATALLLDHYPATRRANQKRPDVLVQLPNLGGAQANAQRECFIKRSKYVRFRSRRRGD